MNSNQRRVPITYQEACDLVSIGVSAYGNIEYKVTGGSWVSIHDTFFTGEVHASHFSQLDHHFSLLLPNEDCEDED